MTGAPPGSEKEVRSSRKTPKTENGEEMDLDPDIKALPAATELEKAARPKGGKAATRPLTDKEEWRAEARRREGLSRSPRKSKRYDGRAVRRHHRTSLENVLHNFYIEVDLPDFKRALDFSKDPKYQMLLVAINNPNLSTCTFPELCKRCNLSINDIAGVWRNYQLSRGMIQMMNHMPQVMEDVAVDAQSRTVTCVACGGLGKVQKVQAKTGRTLERICEKCRGDGKVRIMGDKDSRKLAFEAAGLLQSAQVNVNTQVNVGGGLPSLEDEIGLAEKAFDVKAREVTNDSNGGEEKAQANREETRPHSGEAGNRTGDSTEEYKASDPRDYTS